MRLQPPDWANTPQQPVQQQSPHPAKRVALSSNVTRPPIPSWSSDTNITSKNAVSASNHVPRSAASRQSTSVPINLSLSEDERSPNQSNGELHSPQLGKAHPAVGANSGNSPAEEADPLYEYFPLSVDDWYVF